MRLHVRHQTRYRYAAPIAYAVQTLRLSPRRRSVRSLATPHRGSPRPGATPTRA